MKNPMADLDQSIARLAEVHDRGFDKHGTPQERRAAARTAGKAVANLIFEGFSLRQIQDLIDDRPDLKGATNESRR